MIKIGNFTQSVLSLSIKNRKNLNYIMLDILSHTIDISKG